MNKTKLIILIFTLLCSTSLLFSQNTTTFKVKKKSTEESTIDTLNDCIPTVFISKTASSSFTKSEFQKAKSIDLVLLNCDNTYDFHFVTFIIDYKQYDTMSTKFYTGENEKSLKWFYSKINTLINNPNVNTEKKIRIESIIARDSVNNISIAFPSFEITK